MELLEAIKTRRSIRQFQNRPVADEQIQAIIEAAMMAPSAGNQQPWHFIIIRDRAKLDAIPGFHPYSKMVLQAPVGPGQWRVPGRLLPFGPAQGRPGTGILQIGRAHV